tara:strand:- start:142 stop:309 length:168 start_codon:yes stop_codon:yes gene_type:complete
MPKVPMAINQLLKKFPDGKKGLKKYKTGSKKNILVFKTSFEKINLNSSLTNLNKK